MVEIPDALFRSPSAPPQGEPSLPSDADVVERTMLELSSGVANPPLSGRGTRNLGSLLAGQTVETPSVDVTAIDAAFDRAVPPDTPSSK